MVLQADPPHTLIPSTDGVRIAVHDLGGPDDPAAPVLFLSHATGFCGAVWGPMASHLTDRHRCLAIDYRGHGRSETPEGASLAWSGMGDDAVALLDSGLLATAAGVHGIGHSMGGAALVLAAAHRPGALRSLWLYEPVLVPPGMLPPSGTDNPMATAASRRRARFPSSAEAMANFASKPPLNQLHPDALAAYVSGGFALEEDGSVTLRCLPATEAAVYAGASQSGAWEKLPELDLPVAIVAGRTGEFGPVEFAPFAAAALPHGVLMARPDLRHFGPLEDPASMARDVADWVEANT